MNGETLTKPVVTGNANRRHTTKDILIFNSLTKILRHIDK